MNELKLNMVIENNPPLDIASEKNTSYPLIRNHSPKNEKK